MSFCTTCGTAGDAGSQYCTGCGAQLTAPRDGRQDDEPGRHHPPLPVASPAWPDVHPQPPLDPPSWPASQEPPRSLGRFVLILAAVVLLAGVGGVTAWAALAHRTGNSAPPAPLPPTAPAPPAESSANLPADPPSAVSPEDDALNRLTQQISLDRPQVQGELAEKWVPQLSSKQPGLVVDGMTYHYVDILNDHLGLRSSYDARLVWSGDWSSFRKDDFYVTVASASFSTPQEANAWCDTRAIDPENCFAKLLSAVAGPEGSTVSR